MDMQEMAKAITA